MEQAGSTNKIDYFGGRIYESGTLKEIAHEEGRILATTTGFEYHYYLRDHLGNVRVEFKEDADGEAAITQENHYYPFGMRFSGEVFANNDNDFRYNGKEMQDDFGLDWYDYGARFYDPALGRWHAVDPLADKAPGWTPYRYGFNNPMSFIDPDGRAERKQSIDSWLDDEDDYYSSVAIYGGQGMNGSMSFGSSSSSKKGKNAKEKTATGSDGGEEKVDDQSYSVSSICKLNAKILRYSPLLGFSINPLYGAEAIMIDVGITIAGAEGDVGYVFILAGPDEGKLVSFDEIAGGVGSDMGIGSEFTRIDYKGDINDFTISSLEGPREKFYGGIELTGEGLSVGGAFTYGKDLSGGIVQGISIQMGLGVTIIPYVYGGYNTGDVNIHNK